MIEDSDCKEVVHDEVIEIFEGSEEHVVCSGNVQSNGFVKINDSVMLSSIRFCCKLSNNELLVVDVFVSLMLIGKETSLFGCGESNQPFAVSLDGFLFVFGA